MKNLFLIFFSFGCFCAAAQTFEQTFNNYLIAEQEKALRKANNDYVFEQNLKVLDNLLKKPVLQSYSDVALLYALDNVSDDISVAIDSAKSTDTLKYFIISINMYGDAQFIFSSIKNKANSGLASPSVNTSFQFGPLVLRNEVDILPKRTTNIEADNTVYLDRIKELITIHRDKLAPQGITVESYMKYEKEQKLKSTAEYLSFRSYFIKYMYVTYNLPLSKNK